MQDLNGIESTENNYDSNYNTAEALAYLVGKDNLLRMHFYNDIDGLRDALMQYGVNWDRLCELSQNMRKTMENSYGEQREDRLKCEQEYQEVLNNGFIAKRCQELGVSFSRDYYKRLSKGAMKTELMELQEFAKTQIADASSLNVMQTELATLTTKRNFVQKILGHFLRRQTQALPPPEKPSIKMEEQISSWDLRNWGINPEEFRSQTNQIVLDSLQNDYGHTKSQTTQIESDEISQ